MVACASCGTENEAERRFCRECGARVSQTCPSCDSVYDAALDKFCGRCGAPLPASSHQDPVLAAVTAPLTTEHRLVSVLFADLVGSTTLAERLGAEKMQRLGARYYEETCKPLIARYGGVVEKFIGDAVMAVWGTPSARENDAERAVRTALELVAAIPALGQEMGIPNLRARVGVATGEAVVTLGAVDQGMVSGGLVSIASRIQNVAAPGSVWVSQVTKRLTEEAIVYEDKGPQHLRGATEPVRLWQANRVIGLFKGALKSSGLESPFVGRDAELRLVKERFHASSEDRRACLISASGAPGMGKSRLEWEFRKYLGGLADPPLLHRGRCLPYGDGVTYSALAEMVKWRAGIAEGEDRATALTKLGATTRTYLSDEQERQAVFPHLAHLVGLETRGAANRLDLFWAWRRFFEGMAEQGPTVLIFEDLHWADDALLEFIDYLVDRSRNHPLFVMTLARPEFDKRRPDWDVGRTNFAQLHLDALHRRAMEALLGELVPGLPEELRSTILEQAEGIPLYAVEIVRMLLDRGNLVLEGSAYRPVGTIGTLKVPESLQALIAQRLDDLDPEERQLLQDASVLGKAFSIAAAAAVTGRNEAELKPVLESLVRKEILWVQTDYRSPERNQYIFLQELVRQCAYDRLASTDRKAHHLAAASYLDRPSNAEDESVEMAASHYLRAYEAVPDALDAAEVKADAVQMLLRAGHRAASLAATREAQRYFDQAADLADDALNKGQILERAGLMALRSNQTEDAESRFAEASRLFQSIGATPLVARVAAYQAEIEWQAGKLQEAIGRMEGAFDVLSEKRPDEDLATLAAQIGRFYFRKAEVDRATGHIETALSFAESLPSPPALAEALDTKSLIVNAQGRPQEALALARRALAIARERGLPLAMLRANRTLGFLAEAQDCYPDALAYHQRALDLARKVGDRRQEWRMLAEMSAVLCLMGRWDEALQHSGEIPKDDITEPPFCAAVGSSVEIHLVRGDTARAKEILASVDRRATWVDVPERMIHVLSQIRIRQSEGKHREALAMAEEALGIRHQLGMTSPFAKAGFVLATEAAFALGAMDKVRELLDIVEALLPGQRSPFVDAQVTRFRARLAAARGDWSGMSVGLKEAAQEFHDLRASFWEAMALLEHGELLSQGTDREGATSLLASAEAIFRVLKADPYVKRAGGAPGAEAQ